MDELPFIEADDLTALFEYDEAPGFKIRIKYVSPVELTQMFKRCKRIIFIKHQKDEQLNEEKYHEEVAGLILGWEGLTPEILGDLIPVKPEEMAQKEVSCTDEMKLKILKGAYNFSNFVVGAATALQAFQAARRASIVKNSLRSPGGTE